MHRFTRMVVALARWHTTAIVIITPRAHRVQNTPLHFSTHTLHYNRAITAMRVVYDDAFNFRAKSLRLESVVRIVWIVYICSKPDTFRIIWFALGRAIPMSVCAVRCGAVCAVCAVRERIVRVHLCAAESPCARVRACASRCSRACESLSAGCPRYAVFGCVRACAVRSGYPRALASVSSSSAHNPPSPPPTASPCVPAVPGVRFAIGVFDTTGWSLLKSL